MSADTTEPELDGPASTAGPNESPEHVAASEEIAAAEPTADRSELTAGPERALGLLQDVQLELTVELGRSRLRLRELLALTPGTILELDRRVNDPVELLVNGSLIARGEVVVVGDDFGIRLAEVVDPGPQR